MSIDDVQLTPKTVGAVTSYSRRTLIKELGAFAELEEKIAAVKELLGVPVRG